MTTHPEAAMTRELVLEEAAQLVEQMQETHTSTNEGDRRHLTPRKAGNLAGLAYADGIRALHAAGEALSAQSDAQPVAWRYSYPGYPNQWNLTNQEWVAEERRGNIGCIVEPLYTAPPRPDASGLIEAAEPSLEQIDKMIDAGAKASNIYEVAVEDILDRKLLRKFMRAALRAAPSPTSSIW